MWISLIETGFGWVVGVLRASPETVEERRRSSEAWDARMVDTY